MAARSVMAATSRAGRTLGLGAALAAAALAGCRSGERSRSTEGRTGNAPAPAPVSAPASASAVAPPPPPAYRPRSVPDGHAVELRLTYAGKPRAPWPVPAAYAPHCAGASEVPDPSLELGPHGGVTGAVVWLDDVREGEPLDAAPAVQDEERCAFVPHVLAMGAGAPLRLTNGDPANHAVRLELLGASDDGSAPPVKVLAAHGEDSIATRPAWAGRVARVTCPIHPWMLGWIHFFDHPYFAVTKDGVARIEKVPPGTWHLRVWHEALDARQGDTVAEGPPIDARFEVKVGAHDVTRALTLRADGSIR